MGVPGLARKDHLRRDEIVVQKPAERVDLVDEGVVDRHGRHVLLRHGRVAVARMDHQRLAQFFLHRALEHDVALVEATHEADLNQTLAALDLGVDDAFRGLGGRCQRLLAEDQLAGRDRRQNVLLVRGAGRADEHRVDVVRRDKRFAAVEDLSRSARATP